MGWGLVRWRRLEWLGGRRALWGVGREALGWRVGVWADCLFEGGEMDFVRDLWLCGVGTYWSENSSSFSFSVLFV